MDKISSKQEIYPENSDSISENKKSCLKKKKKNYIFNPISLDDLMDLDSLCSSDSDCLEIKGHTNDSISSISI